jgi:hypothetical protein
VTAAIRACLPAGVAAVLVTAGLAAAPARAASVTPAGGAVSVQGLDGPVGAGAAKRLAAAMAAMKAKDLAAATKAAPVAPAAAAVVVKGTTALATAATGVTAPVMVTASYDFTSYPVAEMTAVVNTWLPQMVGLTAGAPYSEVSAAIESLYLQQDPPEDWQVPSSPDLTGETATVTPDGGTGATVTISAPAPAALGTPTPSAPDGTIPPTAAAILAHLAAIIASVAVAAVGGAYAFGLPTNDSVWTPAFGDSPVWVQLAFAVSCGLIYGQTQSVSYWSMAKGLPPSSDYPWGAAIGNAIGGTAGVVAAFFTPALIKLLQYDYLGWLTYMGFGKNVPEQVLTGWWAPRLTAHTLSVVQAGFNSYTDEIGWSVDSTSGAAEFFGFWTPVAAGLVGNVPSGSAVAAGSGDCMDAYGSNGDNEPASPPAVPGQSVAINACNGNKAQVFDFWPGGQIENWGLCMDDTGDGTNSDGHPLVNLQRCDGGYSQQWYENTTGEIVNVASGLCLDDFAFNTTPGTQLVVYACNGQANQLWAPPGGTTAITGYGPMYSEQQDTSGTTYCMMPQTTLANPLGTNILIQPNSGSSSNCSSSNAELGWARGSNGTLMANGTSTLCLDPNGAATTGPGGAAANFVVLEPCDGSSSQVWNVVITYLGPRLENAADGECLNTPSGQLPASAASVSSLSTLADSMIVTACASVPSPGELWTPPGVAAVSGSPGSGPCDIYAQGGTPCVAAFSTTRSMYSGYDGPLYQVTRVSDNTARDIGLLAAGGDVDAPEQDRFCADTSCTITKIYGQAPSGTAPGPNTLTVGPAGEADPADRPADAGALKVSVGGHEAYGVDITGGMGYRDDSATGVATGSEPEGMYMVAGGTHVNGTCCFDFGNAETDNDDDFGGTMDAVNFGTHCFTSYGAKCSGSGPWVAADLENGLFQGAGTNPNNYTGNSSDFVTAMLKNDGTSTFGLESGNAQSGGLATVYDGALPPPEGVNKWAPMSKQGAIILGIGGDNSNGGVGSFFEGVMTAGTPSGAADAAVQANIVAAQYAGDSFGEDSITQNAGAAVAHQGYASVYTVDAKNGDLQETYLSQQGADWRTQDLTRQPGGGGPPPVKQGTTPVAVVHDGYTSVFTISASDNHVWETYLSNVGNTWASHDLTVIAGTPPSKVTPSALYHDGYTTVYTIDASDGHLQTTYLTAIGAAWVTADLTAQTPGAPAAQPGTSPVSIFHDGYTSVFTVGAGHDIWETYLPSITGAWAAHDITALSGGPQATSTVTAVFHQGYLSVYAAGDPLRHLWELYLPAIGGAWKSQDLTAQPGGGPPPVAAGTSPVGLFHTGYVSVYTVDEQTMHLRETYLSNVGNTWATHDLSALGSTPPTTEAPIALLHPGISGALDRTSVFTVNQFDNDLQDTYLPAIGDSWQTQDLTYETVGPPVMVDASPTATWSVASNGYTYVFTVNGAGDLVVSYLTAQGAAWQTEDLTAAGQAPRPMGGTSPVAVAWAGHVSVFTVGDAKGDLWQTYLPANGGTWAGTDLTAAAGGPPTGVTPAAVFHGGYLSAYTVDDGSNPLSPGDLEAYYLPAGSGTWQTQDLSLTDGRTPQVAPVTSPAALYHDGYDSVYTRDNGSGDLQETYLASIGGSWATQDLTAAGGAPHLADYSSPAALYHSGYAGVYEVDGNGHVWATYLTAIGDSWASQDLTAKYSVPNVPTFENILGQALPVPSYVTAVYHSGYASIFTVDSAGDVHESFLPAIGDGWQTRDLSQAAAIPKTSSVIQPSALEHYDASGGLTWTTVYTISTPGNTLQATYLQRIGDNWVTERLPS